MKLKNLFLVALVAVAGLTVAACSNKKTTTTKASTTTSAKTTTANKTTTSNVEDTRKISIIDNASSANTSDAVNGFHVYDPESKDKDDYIVGETIVPYGKKVICFVYNYASDVDLSITSTDPDFESIYRTYPVEYFDTVDGEVVEKFEIEVKGDMTFKAEVRKEINFTVDYKCDSEDIMYMLASTTTDSKEIVTPILDDKPYANQDFRVMFMNNSYNYLKLSVTVNGEAYPIFMDEVGIPEEDFPGMGGFMIPASDLTGDVVVTVTSTPAYCSLTVNNPYEDIFYMAANVTDDEDQNVTPITSNQVDAKQIFRIMFYNSSDYSYTITVTIDGEEYEIPFNQIMPQDGEEPGMGGFQILVEDLTGDIVITISQNIE